MPQRDVLEYPDPRLRRAAEPVTDFDASLAGLVDDLVDTLRATRSIGLSAPQFGDLRRVVVIDPAEQRAHPQIYVNPEILRKRGLGFVEERCLSVPGVVGNVIRAMEIRVRAEDATGEAFERELSGMDAVCLQHEMDHLEGRLFVDRLSIFRRLRLRWSEARARRRSRAA